MNRLTRKTDGRDYWLYCRHVEFDNEVLERNDPLLYENPQDFYNAYPYQTSEVGNEEEILNKLGQYEDLQAELNFDLKIVIKALLNGVYCTHSIGERNYFSGTELSISGNHEALVVYENNIYWITRNGERIKQQRTIYKRFEFKDYGKTWWLKEDFKSE